MDTLVSHPLFEYRISYRRLLENQARLLARFLNGQVDDYPVFVHVDHHPARGSAAQN
jgi:CRISPR-associated protein Cas1